jgi:hypothetical protein
MRKILGPKMDQIREWRKLHNEELHDLNSAPNVIGVIKPRTMRLVGLVACIGDRKGHKGLWWGDL